MKKRILKKYLAFGSIFIIVTIILVVIFRIQTEKETIKIGVLNTFTGPSSPIGVRFRNAIMLAVEKKNNAGGINGHLIELIFKDDKADPENAKKLAQELIDEGVVAIFGPYLSTATAGVLPVVNSNKIIMLNMGSTSHFFSGLDDSLIRLTTQADRKAPIFAYLCYHKLGLKRMAVVTDVSNYKFTTSFYQQFKKKYEYYGGKLSAWVKLSSKKTYNADDIVSKVTRSKPQGVILITNSNDGALFCQHLRKSGSKIKIIVHTWVLSGQHFITSGGKAVNGVFGVTDFSADSKNEKFQKYSEEIYERFGTRANEPEQSGYEAAQILFYALSKTRDPRKLKKVIVERGKFNGLVSDIFIDKNGDITRESYIIEIQEGVITLINKITNNEMKKYE